MDDVIDLDNWGSKQFHNTYQWYIVFVQSFRVVCYDIIYNVLRLEDVKLDYLIHEPT